MHANSYKLKSVRPPLSTHRIDSPLGPITLAASELGLCGLWFDDQKHGPTEADQKNWQADPGHPVLLAAADQIGAYFEGQAVVFNMALDLSAGTPFQQSVWQALLSVPASQTRSYGDLAKQLDKLKAVRAVGAAIGKNPWSIVVPCHRIIGANGSLTGYAGGLERKISLLHLEKESPCSAFLS